MMKNADSIKNKRVPRDQDDSSWRVGEIGEFQLINLLESKVPFLFLDLSEGLTGDLEKVNSSTNSLEILRRKRLSGLRKRLQVTGAWMGHFPLLKNFYFMKCEAWISQEQLQKGQAIVLICKDGKQSARLHAHLDRKGFINVFYVKKGWMGLDSILPKT